MPTMTFYNIQSQVTLEGVPLVIDIRKAKDKPVKRGTLLDAYQPTGNDNQWWALVPSSAYPGWFTIQSKLTDLKSGEHLVIDIQKAKDKPVKSGTLLDVWTPTDNLNQLWQFVEITPGWSVIQSKLTDLAGNPLVIDIHGASKGAKKEGIPLDTLTENNKENQLWMLAG
jgi:hypothetical protein